VTCLEAQPLLHAYLDGELDLTASLAVERHLESCNTCSAIRRKLDLLHAEIADADLDFASDAPLRRIRASVERRAGLSRPQRRGYWLVPAFAGAAVAALVFALFVPGRFNTQPASIDREIVDGHLRSLLAGRLIDVPSSDRHTVKPWFQGKIEFSPPVPDLTTAGFVLTGGRLDVLGGRKVAVIVYKRRDHVIGLWISPGDMARDEPALTEFSGYRVLRWSTAGMTYRAVSDVDATELRAFANAIRGR